jgi:hypothetical protein
VTSATISDLVEGDSYSFTIKAINAIGSSIVSNTVTGIPVGLPGPPEIISITPYPSGKITVLVAAGNPHSSPITSFVITFTEEIELSYEFSTDTSPVDGDGFYICECQVDTFAISFSVSVVNINGVGSSESTPGSVSVPIFPNPPGNFQVTDTTGSSGSGSVTLSWTTPNDRGSAITAYKAYVNGVLTETYSVGGPYTISGLTVGTAYTFTVKAVNAYGSSPDSASVMRTPTRPLTVPGVPTEVIATYSGTTYTLKWKPPTNDGGTSIISYSLSDGIYMYSAATPFESYWSYSPDIGTLTRSGSDLVVDGSGFFTATFTDTVPAPGFSPDRNVSFGVRATNSVGTGTSAFYHVPIPSPP